MPGEILTSVPDDHVGRMALIEAIRSTNDTLGRVARQQEAQDAKIDKFIDAINELKTSIALLENSSVKEDVRRNREDIDRQADRIKALEADLLKRQGGLALAGWFGKYWPMLVGLGGLAVALSTQV